MGKKRSWFSLVKGLFIPEAKSKEEKKSKRWRWVFGRIKLKQYPAIAVPDRILSEAREEQRKHALAVAIATVSAAEAAIAAAYAAAEVVRLTGAPEEFEKSIQNLAALKIQTFYRAHLARKALSALKGIVRLQAVVRGQIVRRRIITELICLKSIAKTHSQIRHMRGHSVDEVCKNGENKQFFSPKTEFEEKAIKLECKSHRNWDYRLFSKEDTEVLCSQKQEAITKRMKRNSFSQRERRNGRSLEELMTNKEDGTQNHRCEKRTCVEACRRRETENLKSTIHSNSINSATYGTRLKIGNARKQDSTEELNSPVSLPRRSFCRQKKENSTGDDSSLPNSPIFPTYMAATESAKAKARSMSTPKQRIAFLDVYSVHGSTFKPNLSSCSSFTGELAGNSGNRGTSQYISLRTKGHY